ncbi:MAG: 60S ribosomal subunit assembly/export protein [Vezdaea aestivalis]|nr:MAG: 60S ribosomal subunit assembly/export protein [Vezdaea aestivalis]
MAPTKPAVKKKESVYNGKERPSGTAGSSKSKRAGKVPVNRPPPKQQKTKSVRASATKKKKTFTDKELDLPKFNMITPVGVQKPKGKKKGKVFVDDQESLMTILAMVNADKEGQIESKMVKARHLEEIREARQKEAEVRQEEKRKAFEKTKNAIKDRKKRLRGRPTPADETKSSPATTRKKSVTFLAP